MNYFSRPAVVYDVNISRLIHLVCEHFEISNKQLLSRNRKRELVDARAIIMYILYRKTGKTLKEVGQVLSLDHSSVIHHCKKIDGFISVDNNYKELVHSFL